MTTLPTQHETVRVVLDTNVWISGIFFQRGTPAKLLQAWRDGRFEVVLTPAMRDELATVLTRKIAQFGAPTELATQWLAYLDTYGTRVHAEGSPARPSRDPSDNVFLQAATAGRVRFLVTGDKDLLVLEYVESAQIVTPRVFLDWLETTT